MAGAVAGESNVNIVWWPTVNDWRQGIAVTGIDWTLYAGKRVVGVMRRAGKAVVWASALRNQKT
jgi:hypothetical protein